MEGRPAAAGSTSEDETSCAHHGRQWALLRFEQAITAPKDALFIGAKFDADIHGQACRLAFYGRFVHLLDAHDPKELQKLKIYKLKERHGTIERVQADGQTAICGGLFKKETNMSVFQGLKVTTALGEIGTIESSFGQSGKVKVYFPEGLKLEGRQHEDNRFAMKFKRYVFDKGQKVILQ